MSLSDRKQESDSEEFPNNAIYRIRGLPQGIQSIKNVMLSDRAKRAWQDGGYYQGFAGVAHVKKGSDTLIIDLVPAFNHIQTPEDKEKMRNIKGELYSASQCVYSEEPLGSNTGVIHQKATRLLGLDDEVTIFGFGLFKGQKDSELIEDLRNKSASLNSLTIEHNPEFTYSYYYGNKKDYIPEEHYRDYYINRSLKKDITEIIAKQLLKELPGLPFDENSQAGHAVAKINSLKELVSGADAFLEEHDWQKNISRDLEKRSERIVNTITIAAGLNSLSVMMDATKALDSVCKKILVEKKQSATEDDVLRERARLLYHHGIDLDEVSPFMSAIELGKRDALEWLVEENKGQLAKSELFDFLLYTIMASQYKSFDYLKDKVSLDFKNVELLTKPINYASSTWNEMTLLDVIIRGGDKKILDYFRESFGEQAFDSALEKNRDDYILYAVNSGKTKISQYVFELLKPRGDEIVSLLNKDIHGNSVEMFNFLNSTLTTTDKSKVNYHFLWMSAIRSQSVDMLGALLKESKDINVTAQDESGKSALHLVARFGDMELLRHMCSQKNINMVVKDKENHTPLYYAIQSGKSDHVDFILKQGANKYVSELNLALTYYIKNDDHAKVVEMIRSGAIPPNADMKKIESMSDKVQRQVNDVLSDRAHHAYYFIKEKINALKESKEDVALLREHLSKTLTNCNMSRYPSIKILKEFDALAKQDISGYFVATQLAADKSDIRLVNYFLQKLADESKNVLTLTDKEGNGILESIYEKPLTAENKNMLDGALIEILADAKPSHYKTLPATDLLKYTVSAGLLKSTDKLLSDHPQLVTQLMTPDHDYLLKRVIARNDEEMLNLFIEQGLPINKMIDGNSLLYYVIKKNYREDADFGDNTFAEMEKWEDGPFKTIECLANALAQKGLLNMDALREELDVLIPGVASNLDVGEFTSNPVVIGLFAIFEEAAKQSPKDKVSAPSAGLASSGGIFSVTKHPEPLTPKADDKELGASLPRPGSPR